MAWLDDSSALYTWVCDCRVAIMVVCRLSQGGGSPQRALASREEAEALLMVIVFGYISGVFRR